MTALVNNLHNISNAESNEHNTTSFTSISDYDLLKERLYEAYANEMEIVISLESDLFTCNHTLKLSNFEISESDMYNNMYIEDSWTEINTKISQDTEITYNESENTFLISKGNLKIHISFL